MSRIDVKQNPGNTLLLRLQGSNIDNWQKAQHQFDTGGFHFVYKSYASSVASSVSADLSTFTK